MLYTHCVIWQIRKFRIEIDLDSSFTFENYKLVLKMLNLDIISSVVLEEIQHTYNERKSQGRKSDVESS